ncbi:phosphatidate cytidylyltransferase [Anaerotruncus rubiinfantis]|uniref:phosphatidate cytidylyltransferase n=1 Tax=Anaerotruncus rubiinfantis TaxID=1720200 RepID=UPI0018984F52|nr:phosphatidate cytidylyltransferase [Anaerotruncus rubiinfantis]
MKQRIISSAIGLVVLFLVLVLFETAVLNVAIMLIALIAVYELLAATGCWKANRLFSAVALVFSAVIPFISMSWIARNLILICYIFVVAIFSILLRNHMSFRIEQVAMGFMFCIMIPFSLTTIVYLRDRWGAALSIFYVLLALGSAWLSDTGAYFAGRAFGKHKLAPYISPKKTVEGAIGGAVFAEVMIQLVMWLYSLASAYFGHPISIHYGWLLAIVPFLSAVSILGDLSASVIKRQFGVKDYGSIMPGHGGVMDRFDSALMVIPLVFIISQHLPLAQLV